MRTGPSGTFSDDPPFPAMVRRFLRRRALAAVTLVEHDDRPDRLCHLHRAGLLCRLRAGAQRHACEEDDAVVALPVVVLILLSAMQAVDLNLERAALSLGASRARVLLRVVIPIALPGILSAALFAFLASFDELIIALFLSGARAQDRKSV